MPCSQRKSFSDPGLYSDSHCIWNGASIAGFVAVLTLITGCQPSDQRPGLWLSGEQALGYPDGWRFTDELHEIYVQVATPYFLPHSVTIWCAQLDGQLYIGARNPDTKNWPGWVEKNPQIILKAAGTLYDVSLQTVTDSAEIEQVKSAYAQKYNLTQTPGETPPAMRYWRINPS
jgi:hypothetical protein